MLCRNLHPVLCIFVLLGSTHISIVLPVATAVLQNSSGLYSPFHPITSQVSVNTQKFVKFGQSSGDLEFWGGKKRRRLRSAVVTFTGNCSFLLRVCKVVPLNQVEPKPQFVVGSIQVSPNRAFSLILTKFCLCQNPTKT